MAEQPVFAQRQKTGKKGQGPENGGQAPKISPDDKEFEGLSEQEQKERVASQLPQPKGYKLLIALPEIEETTEGGIIKPAETIQRENVNSVVGYVMALGPDAYKGETSPGVSRFPNGPYCKQGDFIIMRAFSGTRIEVRGKEMRLINDDSVEAVVEDPRGIVKR